ncbi:MAG TPA: C25 family cysteine peptidase [Candidatus Thermoplasmatota archaeon]|nr:C25 family cysteine peptidase [Candidatus Thermoplasmatota archaeon]
MKKSLVGVIIAVIIISGYGAVASSLTNQKMVEKTDAVSFSPPQLVEELDSTNIGLSEATSYLTTPGNYALPVVTRVYTFPFLTKITNVMVSFSETYEKTISKPLKLVPQAVADNAESSALVSLSSSSTSPEQMYSYHIAAGRDGDNLATFLAIHLYPIQYLQSDNILRCAKSAKITITYLLPETPSASTFEQFELVIIAPKAFSNALQPLVTHKTTKGMTTKLVTSDDICNSVYFPAEGRDCAEEMKYFIKNAFDQWGTKYVLLVGGRNGGITQEKWWIPVRYSLLNDDGEGSYLTDLYFADLYDSDGNFSSWDSNNNGIFAEWTHTQKDTLDMYPEVYVGRLPCTSVTQVKTMVKKIITYETTTYGSEWFKRFVGVAGDTYPEPNDPYYEGEMATNASFGQLQDLGFTASFIWTSNGKFTGPEPVFAEISKGCGFVHFSGHGNPLVWSNHPPKNDSFVDGPNAFEMWKLSNKDQQPIVIVGGCHNAQFNTSLVNILKGVLEDGLYYFNSTRPFGQFWYYQWIPRCWAWSMASQTKGGAIAVIANTGLGYGEPGEHTLTERGRHLEWLFFKAYADGQENLGETHSTDLILYMNEHPPMDDQIDCKIVQQWALLGDPSLLIGGYSS